jgi:hypothetical protein
MRVEVRAGSPSASSTAPPAATASTAAPAATAPSGTMRKGE